MSELNNENSVIYKSSVGNYTATKISHPFVDVCNVDGIVDLENGEADRGQSYAWSAVGYGDSVYIGTCYGAIWTTIKMMANMYHIAIDKVVKEFNVAFEKALYLGDEKNNPEDIKNSIIIKLNTKTGETKILDNGDFGGYRTAIEFNDKLYFCNTRKAPEIVEIDPNNNDKIQVVYTCKRPNDPMISLGIRAITVCDGELVVSMIDNDGAYIVSSKNPSLGQDSFKTIATQKDLLNYPAYHYYDAIFGGSVFDMASFNNKLYITAVAGKMDLQTKVVPKLGFSLFEGSKDENGKWTYRLIAGDLKDGAEYPYGFGGNRASAANMVVYKDHLYVGGYNDPMIALPQAYAFVNFEDLYKDLSEPVCLWRMDKNGKWELVVGDTNEYFKERVGNMGKGFDNPMCQYVWRMQTYNDKLFVGTLDVGLLKLITKFNNGSVIKVSNDDWNKLLNCVSKLNEKAEDNFKADATKLTEKVNEMTSLLSVGGMDDVSSSRKFKELFDSSLLCFEGVKANISKECKNELQNDIEFIDSIINSKKAEAFFYFIGSLEYLLKAEEGFDLFVTEDGVNFEAITRDGFGDKYNHGLRTFAVNDEGLFIGTANPFYGAQVWKLED